MVSFEDMLFAPKSWQYVTNFLVRMLSISPFVHTLFNSFLKIPLNKAGYCPLYSPPPT